MVGFFGRSCKYLRKKRVLEIIDLSRGLGRKEDFYEKLKKLGGGIDF
jgi:hypothetical protein